MTKAKVAPFGAWKSPLTPQIVASAGLRIGQLRWVDGDLYWVEIRPNEGGRLVIVRRTADGTVSDVTPQGFNARNAVHEYGGGQYFVQHGVVIFSNFDDQRLYGGEIGDAPRPLTPETGLKWGMRYADCATSPDGKLVVGVQEAHHDDGSEATNSLAVFPFDGSAPPNVVETGR